MSTASPDTTRMIITAIDCLKGRKARPDESKICHFVERKFGVKRDAVIAAMKEAVSRGAVLKVKYKDFVSYRNPLKFNQKMSNHIMCDKSWNIGSQTMKRFLRELRLLCRSRPNGVSRLDLIHYLHSNAHFTHCSHSLVDRLITRTIQTGSVKRLANDNYMVVFGKRVVAPKVDTERTDQLVAKMTADSIAANCDDNEIIDNPELTEDSSTASNGVSVSLMSRKKGAPVMARERPISKRKKFKKCLGPDFIVSSELGSQYMRNSFDPKCDLCQNTSSLNSRGESQQLLTCKDCGAKAHPSCMDYSVELAERSSRSPWQCMDCKTCDICHDSKDAANMLVCDLCDKGFHMNCHIPVVQLKPIGKWECNECIDNNTANNVAEKTDVQNIPHNEINDLNDKSETIVDKPNSETSSVSSVASNSKENYGSSYPEVVPNPQKWSPEDVGNFIRNIGFPEQSLLFKEQEIDGTSLLLLRRSDVLTGFHMKLGPALKIYSHIMRLQKND
ncbi:unnamed protein product [Medioppia subpectinata]|uniref:Histone acetyltransferase n=1 Tax=Medioppia subpectinata TaxID=1979941 RepID=A0A7R9KDU0_9ACAR|nr:unnamed protein product [Medioppia subpectinata]CAG2101319.1 unnamed protein product [Medioppia subpectinata]